jgi:hypothetical protein
MERLLRSRLLLGGMNCVGLFTFFWRQRRPRKVILKAPYGHVVQALCKPKYYFARVCTGKDGSFCLTAWHDPQLVSLER